MPATTPADEQPPAAPIAAPASAPLRMRAPNWTGTLRLGVDGSWSVTSSTERQQGQDPTA